MSLLLKNSAGRLRFIPRHKFKFGALFGVPMFIFNTYQNVINRGNENDISFAKNLKAPDKSLSTGAHASDYRVVNRTFVQNVVWKAKLIYRAITLLLLFLPSILLSPLFMFARDTWCSIFAWSVEMAGPVFIKLA